MVDVTEPSAAPFVGRYRELLDINDLLRRETGCGSVVLLSGCRGIGKTSFLDRVAQLAKQRAAITERAHGWDLILENDWEKMFRLAARKLVVFTIDDLHLATPRDIHVFLRLCVATTHCRLILVASYLEEYSALAEETAAAISEALGFGALSFRLRPIDRADAESAVEALCSRYNLEIEARMKSGIVESAGGNPGMLHELLMEFRSGTLSEHLVPTSIHCRLSQLRMQMPHEAYRILQIAAVFGPRFSSVSLSELAGVAVDRVADALQVASDLHIVSEDPEGLDGFSFIQPAMHRAIYYSVIGLKRRRLHSSIANELNNPCVGDSRTSLEYESRLGFHLSCAGQVDLATPHLINAADAAYSKRDFEYAIRLYLEALVHVNEMQLAWPQILDRLARCYQQADDWKASLPYLQRLESFFARRGNVSRQLWALAWLIEVHHNLDDFAAAQTTFAALRKIGLSAEMSNYVADGYTVWAWSLWFWGRAAEARSVIQSLAEQSKTYARSYAPAMVARAIAFSRVQPVDSTFALIEEAANLATVTNINLANEYLCVSYAAWELGCPKRALDYNERARILAPRGRRSFELMASIISMNIALDFGRLQTCREHALLLPSGKSCWAMPIAGLVTLVGVRMGEKMLVDDFFRPELLDYALASNSCQWTSLLFRGFAETMVARGMQDDLQEQLRIALSRKETLDPRFSIPLCAAQYGRSSDVARARAKILPFIRGPGADVAKASLALFDALVASRRGHLSEAQKSARRAVPLFEKLEWPLMAAKALEIGGSVTKALELYHDCQALGDFSRLAGTRDSRARRNGSPLTRREAHVKTLLERGITNREIADSLCISERTTAHHVEAVLGKLGLRSRWQLVSDPSKAMLL
jgi:DNA-binding CsgD family transcriptional regulator/tetratricopeptide (TPR) repeat protein